MYKVIVTDEAIDMIKDIGKDYTPLLERLVVSVEKIKNEFLVDMLEKIRNQELE